MLQEYMLRGSQLRLLPSNVAAGNPTVFTGIHSQIEVVRQRFAQEQSNVVPLRKPHSLPVWRAGRTRQHGEVR